MRPYLKMKDEGRQKIQGEVHAAIQSQGSGWDLFLQSRETVLSSPPPLASFHLVCSCLNYILPYELFLLKCHRPFVEAQLIFQWRINPSMKSAKSQPFKGGQSLIKIFLFFFFFLLMTFWVKGSLIGSFLIYQVGLEVCPYDASLQEMSSVRATVYLKGLLPNHFTVLRIFKLLLYPFFRWVGAMQQNALHF